MTDEETVKEHLRRTGRMPRRLPLKARLSDYDASYQYEKRPCRCCGRLFWAYRSAHRDTPPFFCSPACRVEYHRQRRQEKRHAIAAAREIDYGTCAVCGQPLRATAQRTSRRYCSDTCRQSAYRQRNAER